MKSNNSLWWLPLLMALVILGFTFWHLIFHSILFGATFGSFLDPNSWEINLLPLQKAAIWMHNNPLKSAIAVLPLVGYWFFFKISLAVSFLAFRSYIMNECENTQRSESNSPLDEIFRRSMSADIR